MLYIWQHSVLLLSCRVEFAAFLRMLLKQWSSTLGLAALKCGRNVSVVTAILLLCDSSTEKLWMCFSCPLKKSMTVSAVTVPSDTKQWSVSVSTAPTPSLLQCLSSNQIEEAKTDCCIICVLLSVQQHCFLHNNVHWDVLVRFKICVRDSVLSLLTRLHLFPPHKNSCRRLYGAGSALSGCGFLLASSRSERKLSSRADLRPATLPLGSESLFESSSPLHKKKSCFGVVVFLLRLRARPMRSRPWGVTELI